MSKCPVCNAKIDRLNWWSNATGVLLLNWQVPLHLTRTIYKCPECDAVLFSDKDNAAVFLENETYPNETALYKCSRCSSMVKRVYYHIWQVGDICESCRSVMEPCNIECKIEDGCSIDYLFADDLRGLWNVMLKTRKSIYEQIVEAIKDYVSKNLPESEKENKTKIENRD